MRDEDETLAHHSSRSAVTRQSSLILLPLTALVLASASVAASTQEGPRASSLPWFASVETLREMDKSHCTVHQSECCV